MTPASRTCSPADAIRQPPVTRHHKGSYMQFRKPPVTHAKPLCTGRRTALRYLSLVPAAMLLVACSRTPDFKGLDISASPLTMTVTMTDHTGRRR